MANTSSSHISSASDRKGLSERREIKRQHLSYYLRVYNRNTGRILGHIVNLSDSGFMLVSCLPIMTDQRYQLRMVLPDSVHRFTRVDFDAWCHWSQQDIAPDAYDSGFSVLENDSDAFSQLSEALTEYFSFKS